MTDLPPSSAASAATAVTVGDGALRLPGLGVIRVRGADAAAFLHGQLTQDIKGLGLSEARLAAFCSAKGRMLASFIGFKRSHDEIWLACRADLLAPTLKRLSMFVLRAKARLDAPGDEAVLLGLAGASATVTLGAAAGGLPVWGHRLLDGGASLVHLPDAAGRARWLWAGPASGDETMLASLPPLPASLWDWLEVQSGVAPVVAATVEAFVPQMLNYELVGGVNFQKGCYPGQEVVARSQYRGTLKRRAQLLHGEAPMTAGQDVWWSGDAAQPSGLVAFAAPAPGGGHDALVELKLAVFAGGSLHLGAVDGPALLRMPLPYALPAVQADATAG